MSLDGAPFGFDQNVDYVAGPVWHLAVDEQQTVGRQDRNWFDAPVFDQAWWQQTPMRVLAYFHDDGKLAFGSLKQTHSQDTDPNVTTYAYRAIQSGKTERFLTVFVPHTSQEPAQPIASSIQTSISDSGTYAATIGKTTVTIDDADRDYRNPARSRAL